MSNIGKMPPIIILGSVLILTILTTLIACSKEADMTEESLSFFAMDTYMSLSATGDEPDAVLLECEEMVLLIEEEISRTDENSDIYILNHSNGEAVTVSDMVYEILTIAVTCAEQTNGAFDPTICAITDLWGIGTEDARVPSEEEISNALATVSYENILLLEDNQVQLLNGAQVDLGAVGKGYAADILIEIYENHNIVRGVISLAGNIYVYGEKESGDFWSVGIIDPDNVDEISIALQTTQNSVVTTGAYERYFEEDGIIYHHIFDSASGYPTDEDIKSVTVISEHSTLADIYATALFAMGYEDAISFVEAHDEIDVIIIRDNDFVYYSEGLAVTLDDKYTN